MIIKVNKNTLPRVHGAEVFIEIFVSTSTIWMRATWDAEKKVFERKSSDLKYTTTTKPAEVVQWFYMSDRYIAPRKLKVSNPVEMPVPEPVSKD